MNFWIVLMIIISSVNWKTNILVIKKKNELRNFFKKKAMLKEEKN